MVLPVCSMKISRTTGDSYILTCLVIPLHVTYFYPCLLECFLTRTICSDLTPLPQRLFGSQINPPFPKVKLFNVRSVASFGFYISFHSLFSTEPRFLIALDIWQDDVKDETQDLWHHNKQSGSSRICLLATWYCWFFLGLLEMTPRGYW